MFPRFFSYTGFETFQNREIATGGDAIKKQLISLNLQNIINQAHSQWKDFAEQKLTGNLFFLDKNEDNF